MSKAAVRQIRRCKDAIHPHDPYARVIATLSTNAHDEQTWTIETESEALARRGRKAALVCGIAGTPSAAAGLFIEGLRLVLEQRAGEAKRRRA